MYGSSFSVKTCVIGAQGVGKTSLVLQLDSKLDKNVINPTVGASFVSKVMDVDSYTLRYQLWDTAGQEAYKSMLPMYYRRTNLALLVYDITCANSFYSLPDWLDELEKYADRDCIVCIIGNKTDLESERVIQRSRAAEFAKSVGALFVETSAKKNEGIKEAFMLVSRQLINLYLRRGSLVSASSLISTIDVKLEKEAKKTKKCCHNAF